MTRPHAFPGCKLGSNFPPTMLVDKPALEALTLDAEVGAVTLGSKLRKASQRTQAMILQQLGFLLLLAHLLPTRLLLLLLPAYAQACSAKMTECLP